MVKFSVLLLLIPACTFISDAEVDAKFSSSDDTTSDPDDADGDGYALSVDCDDTDPGVHPGATEVWYDGVDGDCDEADDWDQDGDGHASSAYPEAVTDLPVDDCDDHDSAIHPGAADDWYDGTDADCAGNDDYDQDGDGFARDDECDDTDAAVYPSDEPEVWYNGVDEDCDGNDADQDGDGYLLVGYVGLEHDASYLPGDCVDDPGAVPDPLNDLPLLAASAIHPDADEVYYDGIDQDCAGDDDFDQDGDGSDSDAWPDGTGLYGDDCDDIDPTVNIDALDAWYDGLDSDCSGGSDYDQDGDGWDAPEGGGGDCDDTDPSVSPGAAEDCSTVFDDDCDGDTNDIGAADCLDYYADADADTYGTGSPTCQCDPDSSVSAVLAGDCDDANANANPGEVEACDTDWDDDCDGSDATALTGDPAGCIDLYEDVDGDGSGAGSAACLCSESGAFTSSTSDDCDDADASVSPDAAEIVADGIDQDCDSNDTCFEDNDLDGWGSTTTLDGPGLDCTALSVADNSGDCDDDATDVHPEAADLCDTTDSDCDGAVAEDDSADAAVWYADADVDGYGDASVATASCTQPAGYIADESDCDDSDSAVHPGAGEYCNGIDDDCEGSTDEGALDASTWYADADGDGFGDTAVATASCDAPVAYVAVAGDCDDTDGTVSEEAALLFSDDFESGTSGGAVSSPWTCFGSSCNTSYSYSHPNRGLSSMLAAGNNDQMGQASTAFTHDFTVALSFYDQGYSTDSFDVALGTSPSSVALSVGWDTSLDASQYIVVNASTRLPIGARTMGWHRVLIEVDYSTSTAGDATITLDGGTPTALSFSSYMSAVWFVEGTSGIATYIDDVAAWEGTGACVPSGQLTWYTDADGDGYGEPGTDVLSETEPAGSSDNAGDCDDAEPLAWTDATEVCEDGVDQDCDGEPDGCGFLGENATGDADGVVNYYPNGWSFVGAPGDVNGDGAVDLALGGSGSVGLFTGPFTAESLGAADAEVTWTGGSWGGTGAILAIASDLDGDGCDDIVITDHQATPNSAHVVYGCTYATGAQTLPAAADATISLTGGTSFSEILAVTPDADEDGSGELFLRDPSSGGTGAGRVYGIAGGSVTDGEVSAQARVTIDGDAGDSFGSALASVGDTDGDGVPELLFGAYGSGDYGRVSLFPADVTGTLTPADADWYAMGVSGDNLVYNSGATPMAGVGDVDGDGYEDVLLGNSSGTSAGRAAYLFRGPLSGGTDSAAADTTFTSVAPGSWSFASSVAAAGDADGDGLADVAISDYGETVDASAYTGRMYVFTGIGAGTISTATAAGVWTGGGSNTYLGYALASGDLDADGYEDLIASTAGTYSTFLLFGGEQ